MGSPLRAFVRIAAYLTLTAALFPVQAFALKFNKPLSVRLPVFTTVPAQGFSAFRCASTAGCMQRRRSFSPVITRPIPILRFLGPCCRPLSLPRPRSPVGRCSAFWQSCSGRSSLIARDQGD